MHPIACGRLACILIIYQRRLALQSQQSLKFCCQGLQLFRVLLSREGFDEGANTLFVLESQHNASIRAASGGGEQGEGMERITRIGLWWKHTYIGDRKEASRSRGRQELEGRNSLRNL